MTSTIEIHPRNRRKAQRLGVAELKLTAAEPLFRRDSRSRYNWQIVSGVDLLMYEAGNT